MGIETTDLQLIVETHDAGALVTNAERIRAFALERIQDYTPEQYAERIPEAKADRAELNKAAKTLNDERLRLEREHMKPFEEFKGIVTETVKAIKDASSAIDDVVKQVEQQEKDERRAEIEAEFASHEFGLVPLDQIFDQRWLNKSTSRVKWAGELSAAITKIKTDLEALDGIEDEADAKACYLDTLDIGRALQHAKDLKARREAVAPSHAPEPVEENPVPAAPETDPVEEPELMTITLTFTGTRAQLKALRTFIDSNGIAYQKG